MPRHAGDLIVQATPLDYPDAPSDPLGLFDFRYYWDFFVSQPLAFKVGLVCLAALLYHAIRRQLNR